MLECAAKPFDRPGGGIGNGAAGRRIGEPLAKPHRQCLFVGHRDRTTCSASSVA